MVRRPISATDSAVSDRLLKEVRNASRPLRSSADLSPIIECARNARVVLLGEASHGTHEFYTWRTAITRRLVEELGFNFIAVEGDWPDCYRINEFIKHYPDAPETAREALEAFRRWPTWMWANEEIIELASWLRHHNDAQPPAARVGFFGLDVYSLWDSLYELMRYLRQHDSTAMVEARRALRCFEPYGEDAQDYARATMFAPDSCQEQVVALLRRVRESAAIRSGDGTEAGLTAEQNALVAKNAEAYYRAMVRSNRESWNVRDRHMAETLNRLLEHHGPDSKAVLWEHNTHIGDARYTDMADDGMVNIGQLARERYGDQAVLLVGFGTYRGRVIAGPEWGEPWEEMLVPPGRTGSWEDVLHRSGAEDKLLMFGGSESAEFKAWRGHRAIGVVYHSQFEQYGNYVPTVLPRRYDAFIYVDRTKAVRPLFTAASELPEEVPETYPTGV